MTTSLTAGSASIFLLAGDPLWMIAAANFTYLIGICMPNIAAWLLRRDLPDAERPYRAPRGAIMIGVSPPASGCSLPFLASSNSASPRSCLVSL
jgi:amino acid transporter